MPSDLLSLKLGARFLLVTLLPNTAFATLIAVLVMSGAPDSRPSWERLMASLSDLSIAGIALISASVVILSMIIHPLNYLLIQIMEGYWSALPFGAAIERAAIQHGEKYRDDLLDLEEQGHDVSTELAALPDQPHAVRPTRLGNVLTAGEFRAGERYGYGTAEVLPHLLHVAGDSVRAQVTEARNQLDIAARLCGLSLLAVPVTTFLLFRHDVWLFVSIGSYAFAWLSYRAAIEGARRFGNELSVAFDLHHLNVWDAMFLARPDNLEVESTDRAPLLNTLLSGRDDLTGAQKQTFVWQK
jgi:hypothetical protein